MNLRGIACAAGLATALAASGCVTSVQRPLPLNTPTKAAVQLPPTELLDVAIQLFDAHVPAAEKDQKSQRIDPNVRAAEARVMPVVLANTLQDTGFWGQVRVVPDATALLDVNVTGTILESRGSHLKLAIKATDATGATWLDRIYEGDPDLRTYKSGSTSSRDPFQNVYVKIADDLAAARKALPVARISQIQRVAQLRFDSNIAAYAYKDYLRKDRKGQYQLVRLPAGDSPLDQRLAQVRERDFALLDTVDDSYRLASETIGDSYLNWRRSDHAESEQEAEIRRSARTRMLMGAAAVIGGIAAADSSSSTAGQILGGVAVAGGIEAFKSGMGQRAEAKAHAESIKQQIASFSGEVAPMNVEAAGRVVELRGTAEQQFQEWRRLLQELYENDTGQAAASASTAADGPR
jgi:hypothetical protein